MNKTTYKWTCTHGNFESCWLDTPKEAFDAICFFNFEVIRERFEQESNEVEPVVYIGDLVESGAISASQVRESYVYFCRHVFVA